MSKFYMTTILFASQVSISDEQKDNITSKLKEKHNFEIFNLDINCGYPTININIEAPAPMYKRHVREVLNVLGLAEDGVRVYTRDIVSDYYRSYAM